MGNPRSAWPGPEADFTAAEILSEPRWPAPYGPDSEADTIDGAPRLAKRGVDALRTLPMTSEAMCHAHATGFPLAGGVGIPSDVLVADPTLHPNSAVLGDCQFESCGELKFLKDLVSYDSSSKRILSLHDLLHEPLRSETKYLLGIGTDGYQ